jgi:hypothetical protein
VAARATTVLNGGAGNDNLERQARQRHAQRWLGRRPCNGGSGNDTLDGGSGSDTMNGDAGNDLFIYRLAENAGAGDLYTGGSGIDTVRLMLTNAEWLNDSIQANWRVTSRTSPRCRRTRRVRYPTESRRDFTFNFGSATTLTVQMMESSRCPVDGVIVVNLDKPFVDTWTRRLPARSSRTGTTTRMVNRRDGHGLDQVLRPGFDGYAHGVGHAAAGAIGNFTASITNTATGDGQGTRQLVVHAQ